MARDTIVAMTMVLRIQARALWNVTHRRIDADRSDRFTAVAALEYGSGMSSGESTTYSAHAPTVPPTPTRVVPPGSSTSYRGRSLLGRLKKRIDLHERRVATRLSAAERAQLITLLEKLSD